MYIFFFLSIVYENVLDMLKGKNKYSKRIYNDKVSNHIGANAQNYHDDNFFFPKASSQMPATIVTKQCKLEPYELEKGICTSDGSKI